MNSTIVSRPAISGIAFPPCSFTAEERQHLSAVAAELSRIDAELERVSALKTVIADAGADYAAGKLGIHEAVALLAFSDVGARAELRGALSGFLKQRAREVAASVQGILEKRHKLQGDHLRKLAADLETKEREQSAGLGIHSDAFEPSELLERLRETHRRHLASPPTTGHRERLRQLLAELADAPKTKTKA